MTPPPPQEAQPTSSTGSTDSTGSPGSTAGPTEIVARGPWALAWRRLRKDKVAIFSGVIIILIVLVAILAPVISSITGHDPDHQDIVDGLNVDGLPTGPSSTYWLGTDQLGRDLFIRIIYGARVSIGVGLVATILTVIVGVVIGMAAGFMGGVVDILLARLIDVVLSVPFLLAGLSLVAIFGQSLTITILVIAFFSWASMARIVRGQVLSLREREFVEAARSLGASNARIMFVDILPNLLMPVIVYASLLIPAAVVTEATLAFLGLGVPVPTPDWGGMISDAQTGGVYKVAWWMIFFPGGALVVTTLAFNLLGDGIRDAFDPRIDRLLKK